MNDGPPFLLDDDKFGSAREEPINFDAIPISFQNVPIAARCRSWAQSRALQSREAGFLRITRSLLTFRLMCHKARGEFFTCGDKQRKT